MFTDVNNLKSNKNQNKVYINPNFKGNSNIHQHPSMHFNPKFISASSKKLDASLPSNGKVYINPNFVKPRSQLHVTVDIFKEEPPVIEKTTTDHHNKLSKSRYSFVRQKCEELNGSTAKLPSKLNVSNILEKKPLIEPNISLHNISKSRYSLVRQRPLSEMSNCFKMSVPTETNTPASKKDIIPLGHKHGPPLTLVKTRYKIVKDIKKPTAPLPSKVCSTRRINSKIKKFAKKKFKKNNIPCPLFKKYGRCLRLEIGKCEFLHDKKHVAICRRFFSGSCYDDNCLFSHTITSNKMPTCSFYLKGICNKNACPYLHVKLNEKSEICKDFLKGYCEKGSECLKRHINTCPDMATHGVCSRKSCSYPHKSSKMLKQSPPKIRKSSAIKRKSQNINKKSVETKKKEEMRYYIETSDGSNISTEEIKPSRCKLGTLPSFIRL